MQRPNFTLAQSSLIDYLLQGRYGPQLAVLAVRSLPAAACSIDGACKDDGVAMGIGWLRAASRRTSTAMAEILKKYESALAAAADHGA